MVCLSKYHLIVVGWLECCYSFIVDFEDVRFWTEPSEHIDAWYVDDSLLTSWDLAKWSCHGIDLYGDRSCFLRPPAYRRNPVHPLSKSSLDTKRNTSKGTNDPHEGPLLSDSTSNLVPLEPPPFSATTTSKADQIEKKTVQRQSNLKLLAWHRPRPRSHLLKNLWHSLHQK